MSRTREAFVLPLLFLTVALLGGVRVADRIVLLPPPLFTLVLAFLLVGVLVRSGALAPERLMSAARSPLANISGAVVIVTAFVAATQAFNVAIPESGLPRLLFSVFLLVLLINTLRRVAGSRPRAAQRARDFRVGVRPEVHRARGVVGPGGRLVEARAPGDAGRVDARHAVAGALPAGDRLPRVPRR